jgi:hypothetical protein
MNKKSPFTMKIAVFLLSLLLGNSLFAQQKKSISVLQISAPLSIDGVLDEAVYGQAQPAKDFVQLMPYNGKPSLQPSEVYVFFDQTAVYVGANLFDSAPDSIFNFFSERDNIGLSDYFGIYFDPYNQGQLAYGFFITPAGVQTDIKAVKGEFDNEDDSWNAVWQSKTRVTDKGWTVEMRIPYSALRFPENGGGTWGMNMFRRIRRYNSNNSWNLIDREVSGFIDQQGEISGITGIKPPVRLSLGPYAAAYTEFKGEGNPEFVYKGGMDLKYGLSESFTLDMMLVPDFGQIQSDDKQLNLTPYELYYSEKRQFFTEGIELFERGNIFYSRRIGAYPKFAGRAQDDLKENEEVSYSPSETQLVNATKVSGRTSGGWGLGMLNAMSLPSYATIRDTIEHTERRKEIQPFTNFNVAVVDKSLKNNSYFSLINTNMAMVGDPFFSNVTATDFQLRNKAKTWVVKGKGGLSLRRDGDNETGFFSNLGVEKNSGKLMYGISQTVYSDKYNPNDLGYLYRNNEMTTETFVNYNINEPFSIFREMHYYAWWDHIRTFRHNNLFANQVGLNAYTQFKNNYGTQLNVNYTGNQYDYYEPRIAGRYYYSPDRINARLFAHSDARFPVIVNLSGGYSRVFGSDEHGNNAGTDINVRVGKRCMLYYGLSVSNTYNDRGYVDNSADEDTIWFARRDVRVLENSVEASYSFTNKASVRLRVRHYWSGAANHEDFTLNEDGTLKKDPAYTQNQDENYNAFNVDLVFRWIFAPGSELTAAWKNSILDSREIYMERYMTNLRDTWDADQINSFSIKILYYIDYNSLRKSRL